MTSADWSIIGDARALEAHGLFVAEGRLVLDRLLDLRAAGARWDLVGVLATPAAAHALHLDERCGELVDVRPPDDMQRMTGFNFHRGVIALVRRPLMPTLDAWLGDLPANRPLVLAEHIVDPDNVGSIFRNARALAAAGVLLDDLSADPLYRKAVRTSTGAVLELPWTMMAREPAWTAVRAAGYRLLALTPARDAVPLRDAIASVGPGGLAIAVGNEGEGLTAGALAACDIRARIPMADGADSLNIATALALALHEVRAVA